MNTKTKTVVARIRGMVAKVMLAGVAAAGAFMIATPVKAQAQEFVVAARAGSPFYGERRFEFERQEFLRREEFARREAFFRHQEWLRAQRFHEFHDYR